jgi:osmotically-inducible protein OsmY
LAPSLAATNIVANEMQKNIANTQANGVSGVFSVTNNLRVESRS